MNENNVISRGVLYFSVSPNIVNLARQGYWYENRKAWAIKLLKCLKGITNKQVQDLLNGNAHLIKDKDEFEFIY